MSVVCVCARAHLYAARANRTARSCQRSALASPVLSYLPCGPQYQGSTTYYHLPCGPQWQGTTTYPVGHRLPSVRLPYATLRRFR
jgi:hypothetical protein